MIRHQNCLMYANMMVFDDLFHKKHEKTAQTIEACLGQVWHCFVGMDQMYSTPLSEQKRTLS